MALIRLSSSFNRSSMAADRPMFAPTSISRALASLMMASLLFERVGHTEQAGVLFACLQPGQLARSRFSLHRQMGHLLCQGHAGTLIQIPELKSEK